MKYLALILLCSCSVIHKAERVQTLEMSNLLESYHETVWNPENNTVNEKDSIKKLIHELVKR